MAERRTGTRKPKDMTCPRCNSAVEPDHAGTVTDADGRRLESWTPGRCTNPQCAEAR